MTPLLLTGTLLVTGFLLFLEARRPDRRHLALRLIASGLALAALAALFHPLPPASSTPSEAILWTAGSRPLSLMPTLPAQFTLPDAVHDAPAHTAIVPDVGTLRRHFPALRSLQVFGDGLDPAELPALTGLRVVYPPPGNPPAAPGINFLSCPRELPLGEPLVVQGRISGPPPGGDLVPSLENPDGTKTVGTTEPTGVPGEWAFTLRAPGPPAAGRFVWQLHAGPVTEPLGVSVVPPNLPRVLVLEGAPHFDTAALRRWFEGAGGLLSARTQVGQSNQRFASTRQPPPEFTTVGAALLSGYDLVLADGRAFATLRPEERTALLAAVEKTGLGLLVLADDAILPPNASSELQSFLPWKFSPIGDLPPGEDRPVRPGWLGQTASSEIPLSAAPFAFDPVAGQTALISDRETRPLAAAFRRGQGKIALTLVRDTTRWQRENDPAAFAAYWSFLFSTLSRPSDAATGHWTLVDGDAGPVFVDHPLTLRWTGPPDATPPSATVTTFPATLVTPLPLAQDEHERTAWQTTFWPRRAGWHRVAAGNSSLDFYVHPAADWPALQGTRRRLATARFAAASSNSPETASPSSHDHPISPAWWFTLFVVSAGYLWTERRLAR